MRHVDDPPDTITLLLERAAARDPEAVALAAPGRGPLTYGGLVTRVARAAETLRALGIAGGDRVAIVAPNGPEMAVAFLAAASCAVCAPLNPDYRESEFDFYLKDSGARTLVVARGTGASAVAAARAAGISVVERTPCTDPEAGAYEVTAARELEPAAAEPVTSRDVALVLHTSGTTSRPKIVPLTHANLCVSAANIRATLGLEPGDRCLNVMPLFHIHGLVGALLSSLAAGASVVCAPGFVAPRFFDWLRELQPTWYTAVPTMHQAILERVARAPEAVTGHSLRFVRSSSAALAPSVLAGIEAAFGVPVVEAYGMTEAAHQMASNPLPPGVRKPGSVGVPAGPEITVLDETGAVVPAGRVGEVAIRGANVMCAYEANPEANASAFAAGWLRTGDLGTFDADGYLTIVGRVKEMINRGGEKISPREVDEALLAHAAVAQAVAFGMADPRLGEEVASAVVLHEGATVSERELREHVASRLASFKVPRRIAIVEAIPKGPTGKLQRIGLAEQLGLTVADATAPVEFVAPRTALEASIAGLWQEVLGLERVGVRAGFFDIGGDSVLAAQVLARVRQSLGREVPLITFFEASTIEALARYLDEDPGAALALEELLDEVEGLSDGDVRRLLSDD
jgi:acyl-CoA synthetase (AMP-forming)/AMP-acid ligase II